MNKNRNLIIILSIIIAILTLALIGAIAYIFITADDEQDNSKIDSIEDSIEDEKDESDSSIKDIIEDVENEMVEHSGNMAVRTFNSQFTAYEGTDLRAPQIKALISMIQAVNSSSEHNVALNNSGITNAEQIDNAKKYNVTLSYDDEGYVNEIRITESSGDQVENPEQQEKPQEQENSTQGNGDINKLIFNTTFTKYLGNITGDKLNILLAEVGTSNEKNPNHIVTLSSNNLPNLDEIGATEIYTITFSYGEDGYVNNINIDKKV